MKGVWLLVELCGCAGGTQGLGWADSIGISLAQVPPCPHQCHVAALLPAGTMCCLCLLAAWWLLSRPLQQISSMKRSSLLHCRDLRESTDAGARLLAGIVFFMQGKSQATAKLEPQ